MRCLRLAGVLLGLALSVAVSVSQVRSATPPPQTTVIGGEPVAPGDYPWLVALLDAAATDEAIAFCGGALIDDGGEFTTTQWVLTAAHCIVTGSGEVIDPDQIEVLVGQQDLTQAAPDQRRAVADVIAHPLYLSDVVLYNDAALLKLASPVTGITPIRIATPADAPRFAPGVTAQIAGWGNRLPQTGSDFPAVAHKAQAPIVDLATCNERYDTALSEMHLCAGFYPNGGIDTCQGDSGGPLMVPDGAGGLLHAGIVSFGIGCAWPHFPGVYARTAFVADWIEAQITGAPHVDIWQLQLPDDLDAQPAHISTAAPDTPFTYTVFVANSGATPLTNPVVIVDLPVGATLVPGSISDGGVYNSLTGEIVWSFASALSPGDMFSLTYQVQASSSVETGEYTVATDQVSADRRRAPIVTLIDQPRPFLRAFAPDEVEVGSVYSVEFAISNFGQGPNADLPPSDLIAALPAGSAIVALSDDGEAHGNEAIWSLPSLPAMTSTGVTIFVRAGDVGDVARFTDYGLYTDGDPVWYGANGVQVVSGPALNYLPMIAR